MSKKLHYLIPFDKNGKELNFIENGKKLASKAVLKVLSEDKSITDVFIMSHGWWNDVEDAQKSYQTWMNVMANSCDINNISQECKEQTGSEFKPLVIGIHWPSKPLGEENLTNDLFSFDTKSDPSVEDLVDLYAKQIADTDIARQALKTIIEAAMAIEEDKIPDKLPPEIGQAYKILAQEIGLSFDGVAAAPGADQDSFDPDKIYQAAIEEIQAEDKTVSFGVFADIIDKVKAVILAPIRMLSFWDKKALACKIGENAIFPLLKKLQSSTDKKVRFHMMGHSFGCIVVSAAIAGPKNGDNTLVRPVNSVSLIQGAFSLWSYCSEIPLKYDSKGRAGYFNSIIKNREKCVLGPIITTQSKHDKSLALAYRAATWTDDLVSKDIHVRYDARNEYPKYGAVGSYGLQGLQIVEEKMHTKDIPPLFELGKEYNLNCDDIIKGHTKFANTDVANIVWSAVLSGIKASQVAKTAPTFSIRQEGDGNLVVDNAELSLNHQLIQSLEQFVESTTQQVEQLKLKIASAQKLLDELKRPS